MANLILDDAGRPIPQYMNSSGTFEAWHGVNGAGKIAADDGAIATLGTITDKDANGGDGSIVALIKNLRSQIGRIETIINSAYDSSTGTLKTTIRKPVEIITHNELAIRDTNPVNSGAIDVTSIAGKKYFRVINGCDQAMTLKLYVYSQTDMGGPIYSTTINANTSTIIASDIMPVLDLPLSVVEVQVLFNTAPTTGTVKVQLCGLPG
ncbi:hypothetical protein THYS13_07310 [Thermoanaerobacter sp. YS13]|uniref:hypothetical protein n=1 Tax=Thermoanaerobacter sp. YS13 TaxID=1511746 RepID=UPI0005754C9F|nr:hypothetical protein [Thermoanaerobacter sp. YS13]KHO62668.1 hypothetical protein THYS13_07310 [Thermoanaerobacter sp. YS13]